MSKTKIEEYINQNINIEECISIDRFLIDYLIKEVRIEGSKTNG